MHVSVWICRNAAGTLIMSQVDPGDFVLGKWTGLSESCEDNEWFYLPITMLWDLRPGKKARANIALEAA